MDTANFRENTESAPISSNWLGHLGEASNGQANGEQMFPGDAIGSQTSHIMWTKPRQSGGVVGGGNFAIAAQTYFD